MTQFIRNSIYRKRTFHTLQNFITHLINTISEYMWHSLILRGTVLAEVDRIGQGLSLKSFCIDISMTFIIKGT